MKERSEEWNYGIRNTAGNYGIRNTAGRTELHRKERLSPGASSPPPNDLSLQA